MIRIGEWMAEYEKQLLAAVQERHYDYPWAAGATGDDLKARVETVSNRMKIAFERGSYNRDGVAIKRTCKAFGIKYTYTAINNFLKGIKT